MYGSNAREKKEISRNRPWTRIKGQGFAKANGLFHVLLTFLLIVREVLGRTYFTIDEYRVQ